MPTIHSNDSGFSECPMSKITRKSNSIIAYLKKKLGIIYKDKPLQKAFHAKTIGLVAAKLTVSDQLSSNLKIGLCKKAGEYQAWVRFTNGDSRQGKDSKKQLRGMAIKIPMEHGEPLKYSGVGHPVFWEENNNKDAQDIIMINSPLFVPSKLNLIDDGARLAMTKGFALIFRLISLLKIFITYRLRTIAFLRQRVTTANLLEEAYYSCSPFKFGKKGVIKWAVRPLKTVITTDPVTQDEHYLRTQLIRDLSPNREESAAFELLIQLQENDLSEPVEDTSVIWKTPFYKIATLHIPPQNICSDERMAFDERLFFSPGYTLPAHGPLGNLNLVRHQVYEATATERLNSLSKHSPFRKVIPRQTPTIQVCKESE